jgi:hypothetical protein
VSENSAGNSRDLAFASSAEPGKSAQPHNITRLYSVDSFDTEKDGFKFKALQIYYTQIQQIKL